MSLTDLIHYVAENAIKPGVFGFSDYVFEPQYYSLVPHFAFLSSSVKFVSRTYNNPYMRIV